MDENSISASGRNATLTNFAMQGKREEGEVMKKHTNFWSKTKRDFIFMKFTFQDPFKTWSECALLARVAQNTPALKLNSY